MQTLSFKDSVPRGEHDLFELITIAGDLGYAGVDLEDRQFASTEPAYLERLRRHCDDLGLPIGYVGVGGGFGQDWHGDDDGHEAHVRHWIDVTAQLGVPLVRLVGCQPRPGESAAAAWPRTVTRLRRLGEFATAAGLRIGLHNHNHGMFPATGDEVLRMLEEVGPSCTHILDTGQYRGSPGASGYREDPGREAHDPYAYIEQTLPRAGVVRAKIYRIACGEEESIDYRRVLTLCRASGFAGRLSVVYEARDGVPPMVAMATAHRFLSGLLYPEAI